MDAAGAAGALRRAGLRVTRPRLQVLAALERLSGHRTADDVAEAVAAEGHRLSRTSVYNALDALRTAGLVMVAETGSGAVLHEVAGAWHHHFVCRVCRRVVDVPVSPGEALPRADLPDATVDEVQVLYRGVCGDCRRAGAAG